MPNRLERYRTKTCLQQPCMPKFVATLSLEKVPLGLLPPLFNAGGHCQLEKCNLNYESWGTSSLVLAQSFRGKYVPPFGVGVYWVSPI